MVEQYSNVSGVAVNLKTGDIGEERNNSLFFYIGWLSMVKKEEMFPELFCEECLKDESIECKRDKDVKCLHCGAELCGYHMAKHLEEKEKVSTTWTGIHFIRRPKHLIDIADMPNFNMKVKDGLHSVSEGKIFWTDNNYVTCKEHGACLCLNKD